MILDHDPFLSCFKKEEDVLWTRPWIEMESNKIEIANFQITLLLILVFLKKEFSILERRITPP